MGRKKTRKQKLPNGFGSIVKRTRNGKEEFRVYAPAVYDETIGDYYQPPLGRVVSYNDGYRLLMEYNDNPKEIESKDITFGFICEKAIAQAIKECEKGKMTESNLRSIKGANNKVQKDKISNIKILKLMFFQLQEYLDSLSIGYTSKGYQINLFNRAISYAKNHLGVNINIDTNKLDIGEKPEESIFKPIDYQDVNTLWLHKQSRTSQIILILIYTGLRPSELLNIKIKNVFLNENYMIGGMKTKAGSDRLIPIHSVIKSLIKNFYNIDSEYLIHDENNKQISLKTFEIKFKELMIELKLISKNYKPYCTRHTFATRADECNFKEAILKVILGHSIKNDVTNSVYIHRKKEQIIKEIEKLNYNIIEENKIRLEVK